MDAIYIDREGCEDFRVDYNSKDPTKVVTTPAELIMLRQINGKTYDTKHMSFFESYGLYREMIVIHKGYGWFEVAGEPLS